MADRGLRAGQLLRDLHLRPAAQVELRHLPAPVQPLMQIILAIPTFIGHYSHLSYYPRAASALLTMALSWVAHCHRRAAECKSAETRPPVPGLPTGRPPPPRSRRSAR